MSNPNPETAMDTPTPGSYSRDDRMVSEAPATSRRTTDAPLARFYMSGDLRAATGLSRTHLDFYLREGIILPTARTESGYLLFDDSEVAVAHQVISWREQGVSIRDIRKRLHRDCE
ncbi:MAG TPA: MerR family transcriptional regulator [Thermomicrobiales bacterium]|nr:MerR family transcriptional regulator [Thermomicrobiales bacterium]